MRVALAFILCFAACREIRTLEPETDTVGYQLTGTVTNSNGIPLDSVSVRLYYSSVPVQFSPLDTVRVIINDSTKFLFVVVYDINFQPVRNLFIGKMPLGQVSHIPWDQTDDSGRFVLSGKYYTKYEYNGAVAKIDSYLVDSHRIALTNSDGEFTLTNSQLPVGEKFDFYNSSDNVYVATYKVLPEVLLIFYRGALQSPLYRVSLQQNKITRGVFKLG